MDDTKERQRLADPCNPNVRNDNQREPEVQGPSYPIEIINRRNGIQYGTKILWIKPKKPKKKAAAQAPPAPSKKGPHHDSAIV